MRTIAIPVAAAAVLIGGAGIADAAESAPGTSATPATPAICPAQTDAQTAVDRAGAALADAQSRLGPAEDTVRSLNADKNAQQTTADNLAAQVRAASVDKIAHQQALPGLQAALDQATAERGTAASTLRAAQNAAAGAADDIALRQGYIAAFKTKYAAANQRAEAAKDEIEKQQKLYRKAKDAGDTAAMDAAHAAADAARAKLATAQADMQHYGPASRATQQGHIDKDQALLDAVTAAQKTFDQATTTRGAAAAALRDAQRAIDADTALGQKLYPQYQAALAKVASIQAAGQAAYQQVLALRGTVTDLTTALADAQKALDEVVCPATPQDGTEPSSTGGPQTGPAGYPVTPQAATTVPVAASAVRRAVATTGKGGGNASPTGAKTGHPVTYTQLAQTGALPGDEFSWLLGGAAVLLAAGGAAVAYGRHAKRD
ncbi:hypothetical protein GCM10022222_81760 [Amycolatopsis ultiminotia]|uniref:Gram-positive cocci surface proteins LPxTG domain-containing protein n=1 Tax=Amycolatopsis ultiminotia TaxID=543629 RepID=A0ABP6YJ88_9PSEU